MSGSHGFTHGFSIAGRRSGGGGTPAPTPPSTESYTYAEVEPSLTGSRSVNSPSGKTAISANNTGEHPGYWAGVITGTDANILLYQNTSSQPANMVQVSLDLGLTWTAALVVGGRYILFSGLPQAERVVLIYIGAAYGTSANMPNSGLVMTVTGAPPSIKTFTHIQPRDGTANVVSANSGLANPRAGWTPVNILASVSKNNPSVIFRGDPTELLLTGRARYFYISADGAAPTRYDTGFAGSANPRSVRVTGLSGTKTYYIWSSTNASGRNIMTVGLRGHTGLENPNIAGLLVQFGDSVTAADSATSTGECDVFRAGIGLNRAGMNYGLSGDTIAGLKNRLPAILAGLTVTGADVAVVAIGRNNVGGAFDSTEIADYQNIVTQLLTAGFGRVICRAILNENLITPTVENASIASIVSGFADARVVFCVTSGWTGINRPDGVHPDDQGYGIVAINAIADYPALIGTLP